MTVVTELKRRTFVGQLARVVVGGAVAGLSIRLAGRRGKNCDPASCQGCGARHHCDQARPETAWQLDPAKCVQCGRCATACVLNPSAVKCFHTHSICGYCTLCFGYFRPGAGELNEGAENQTCPTGAIRREFIEDPYFEYTIDKDLCIGCGRCVGGCNLFGNGSMILQVSQDLCVNCNECAIARTCPADAFRRVPIEETYVRRGAEA